MFRRPFLAWKVKVQGQMGLSKSFYLVHSVASSSLLGEVG